MTAKKETAKQRFLNVQTSLIAPKNQRNNFGKYNYRSCEDILEALKKPLRENSMCLTINDDIIVVNERVYVRATATLEDCESEWSVSTSSLAREPENKKGMDESQITGAASSYARKYALNGLFCIDDTKDADATNTHVINNEDKNNNDLKLKKPSKNINTEIKSVFLSLKPELQEEIKRTQKSVADMDQKEKEEFLKYIKEVA